MAKQTVWLLISLLITFIASAQQPQQRTNASKKSQPAKKTTAPAKADAPDQSASTFTAFEEFSLAFDWLKPTPKSLWSLSVEFKDSGYPLWKPDDVLEYLTKIDDEQQRKYLAPLTDNVRQLVEVNRLFGGELAYYLAAPKLAKPVRLFVRDKKKGVHLTGITNASVFNTLRASSKERAAKVLEGSILPGLKWWDSLFFKTDIAFYAITAVWGARDFLSEDRSKAEQLTFIAPKEAVHAFVNREITDQELLARSEVLMSDKDMSDYDEKKVQLKLE